jgi:hypothetical protein
MRKSRKPRSKKSRKPRSKKSRKPRSKKSRKPRSKKSRKPRSKKSRKRNYYKKTSSVNDSYKIKPLEDLLYGHLMVSNNGRPPLWNVEGEKKDVEEKEEKIDDEVDEKELNKIKEEFINFINAINYDLKNIDYYILKNNQLDKIINEYTLFSPKLDKLIETATLFKKKNTKKIDSMEKYEKLYDIFNKLNLKNNEDMSKSSLSDTQMRGVYQNNKKFYGNILNFINDNKKSIIKLFENGMSLETMQKMLQTQQQQGLLPIPSTLLNPSIFPPLISTTRFDDTMSDLPPSTPPRLIRSDITSPPLPPLLPLPPSPPSPLLFNNIMPPSTPPRGPSRHSPIM